MLNCDAVCSRIVLGMEVCSVVMHSFQYLVRCGVLFTALQYLSKVSNAHQSRSRHPAPPTHIKGGTSSLQRRNKDETRQYNNTTGTIAPQSLPSCRRKGLERLHSRWAST